MCVCKRVWLGFLFICVSMVMLERGFFRCGLLAVAECSFVFWLVARAAGGEGGRGSRVFEV